MTTGVVKWCAAAAVALGAVVIAVPASPHADAATGRAGPVGKIKHVVLIDQENRSFDEVLGDFCIINHRCNGSIGPVKLKDGSVVPLALSKDVVTPDIPHSVEAQTIAVDGGKMDGWSIGPYCHSPGPNNCLTYYQPSQVPGLTALASKYVVSDRTFSFQNAPSWGGHMAPAAATQDGFTGDIGFGPQVTWGCPGHILAPWVSPTGQASNQPACIPAPAGVLNPSQYPYRGAFQATKVPSVTTIFDRLNAAHLPWKLYSNISMWSICPTFAECQYTSQRNNVVDPTQILSDAHHGTLPAYSILLPAGPGGDTGQHPPSSMLVGDNWIAQVVNALQKSPEWSSTAIFITYDDCGCFYDHVPPGHNPDGTVQGVRVPTVIVSPYAKIAGTDSHAATMASVLHFVEEAFSLKPLGVNDAKGYDYAGSFDFTKPGTRPRVFPPQHPVSQAYRDWANSRPHIPNDPT